MGMTCAKEHATLAAGLAARCDEQEKAKQREVGDREREAVQATSLPMDRQTALQRDLQRAADEAKQTQDALKQAQLAHDRRLQNEADGLKRHVEAFQRLEYELKRRNHQELDSLQYLLDQHKEYVAIRAAVDSKGAVPAVERGVQELGATLQRERALAAALRASITAVTDRALAETAELRKSNQSMETDLAAHNRDIDEIQAAITQFKQWRHEIGEQNEELNEDIKRYESLRMRNYKLEVALTGHDASKAKGSALQACAHDG